MASADRNNILTENPVLSEQGREGVNSVGERKKLVFDGTKNTLEMPNSLNGLPRSEEPLKKNLPLYNREKSVFNTPKKPLDALGVDLKRPIYSKILPIENHKFKSEIDNDINKLVNRWFNRLKNESINKESVFVAPEVNFDVPTSKFFYLMLWTKNHIKEKPVNIVKTLDLFTRYKEYMKDAYGDESSIPEGRFYKEIGTMMSMFRIQNTKIKTLGDRGYAGVNYYDSENTTEYLQDRGTTDSYPSDDTADSRKSENTITIEEASKN